MKGVNHSSMLPKSDGALKFNPLAAMALLPPSERRQDPAAARPTWEEYRAKRQADKLNDNVDQMAEYRAALDRERDSLLSRGRNHADLRRKLKLGSSAEGETEAKRARACMHACVRACVLQRAQCLRVGRTLQVALSIRVSNRVGAPYVDAFVRTACG
jgi:hypothetical protein